MAEIRVPSFTDLSNGAQLSSLRRTLRQVRNVTSRTAMPVEQVRTREDKANDYRFRVVEKSDVAPGDVEFGEKEVHFFVGGKWRRVMLEDL